MSDLFSVLPVANPDDLECIVRMEIAEDFGNFMPVNGKEMPCTILQIWGSRYKNAGMGIYIRLQFPTRAVRDLFLSQPGEGRMQIWR